MTAPDYMHMPWFALLLTQLERTSQTALAAELGISVAAINQILKAGGQYGAGTASTADIGARVIGTWGRFVCPYLTAEEGGVPHELTATECRAFAHRPAPVGQPRAMTHWQACRACPHYGPTTPPKTKPVYPRKPRNTKGVRQ